MGLWALLSGLQEFCHRRAPIVLELINEQVLRSNRTTELVSSVYFDAIAASLPGFRAEAAGDPLGGEPDALLQNHDHQSFAFLVFAPYLAVQFLCMANITHKNAKRGLFFDGGHHPAV